MRRRGAVLLCAGLTAVLVVASAATPQETGGGQPHYWPHRTFYIPVNVDKINQTDPKPSDLQLFYNLSRGSWERGAKLPLTGLQDLGDGKKGFKFSADHDGEYEFSVQYWYADGSTSPRKPDELAPMLGVVIDTTPPVVRIASGPSGVRWEASDANLDPRTITLQCKYPNWTKWETITTRPLKPADSFAWDVTKIPSGRFLEVRVLARDRAGNEGYSPVVRVPGDTAIGTAFPKTPVAGSPEWLAGGGAAVRPDPLMPAETGTVPAPRVLYVDGMDITVEYAIQRIGRSGIKAARLYVLPYKDPTGWKLAEEFKVSLQPAEKDQTLSLKYTAKEEGVYGFYVAPESGAGVKADPPRKDDPPMLIVVVDKTAPYVKITGVRVSQGVRGPVVEIVWETNDQNLMPDPISLEYSVDKDAVQWKEIKYRLTPGTLRTDAVGQNRYVGQYAWEVPDDNLWKFYVRIRAVDKAGNTGKHIWGQSESSPAPTEVIVDLEKPAAGITGVKGGTGGTGPATSSPPRPIPPTTLPEGKPSASPGSGPPVPAIPDK
ncbi:MAG: hypothetical protein JWO38_7609 [Gemmataceae bacterium]|nr:hypothetical protein [Gemmataceae bacterium]